MLAQDKSNDVIIISNESHDILAGLRWHRLFSTLFSRYLLGYANNIAEYVDYLQFPMFTNDRLILCTVMGEWK